MEDDQLPHAVSDWQHLQALELEVAYLTLQLRDTDTGHIHTAISVLQNRIEEIARGLGLLDDVIDSEYLAHDQ